MATISQKEWKKYTEMLRKINDKAVSEFETWVVKNLGYEHIERQVLIDRAYAIATKYGEAAASLSSEMYDAIAALQGVLVPAAVPAETAAYSEVAKTVNGVLKKTDSETILAQAIGLLTKDAGQKTILQNAERDEAEIAFVPQGDTCPYCIALASRGWRKASRSDYDKDGEPAHLHANCDCTYAVRFNTKIVYKGYEPEVYKEMYDDAPVPEYAAKSAKNKINAMRREAYAHNKEEINAQKRSAYAKRKERESSAAEEINVD